MNCKHPHGYNCTEVGRHSQQAKIDAAKSIDPRKEFLFRAIGAKIAYYRTLRDMSQKELAKRANMSVSSLSKIERGRHNDNVSNKGISSVIKIAQALQVPLCILFAGEFCPKYLQCLERVVSLADKG